MLVPQPQGIPRTSWDTESRLPRFWGTDKKKFQSGSAPLAKITAHPKSFAAKSIIIITCGDEFLMMVAGPQQHLLIMTFCSCWQSLPVRWLIPNSQHVRRSTHTILGLASPPETGEQQERRTKGRLHLWEGRSVQSSQRVTFKVIVCDILIQTCFVELFSNQTFSKNWDLLFLISRERQVLPVKTLWYSEVKQILFNTDFQVSDRLLILYCSSYCTVRVQ